MPCRWYSGNTETGPRPYQFRVPSEMVRGEKAICPITRPSTSATSDIVRALAMRSAAMINCSAGQNRADYQQGEHYRKRDKILANRLRCKIRSIAVKPDDEQPASRCHGEQSSNRNSEPQPYLRASNTFGHSLPFTFTPAPLCFARICDRSRYNPVPRRSAASGNRHRP